MPSHKCCQLASTVLLALSASALVVHAQNEQQMESMLDQVDNTFSQPQNNNAGSNAGTRLQSGTSLNNGMPQGNGMMPQGNGMMPQGNGMAPQGGPLAAFRALFGNQAKAAPKPPPKPKNLLQILFDDGGSGTSDPSKLGNARENLQTARDRAQQAEGDASRASSGSDKDARRSAAESARYAASAAREAADRATAAAAGGSSEANDAAQQARDAADRAQGAADRATANAEGGGW